jgi:hypothetical protein
MARVLWRLLKDSPIRRFQLILGPRRVGKTTVMYQTVQRLLEAGVEPRRLWWLRLDHPLLINTHLGMLLELIVDVTRCTEDRPAFLFLDELTYAKDWALWLKTAYDEKWPIQVVGTSSAVAAMKKEAAESGVGRWEEQYLGPYSFSEFLELEKIDVPTFRTFDSFSATIEAAFEGPQNLPSFDLERRRFMLTGGFPELLSLKSSGDEASDILRSQTILKSDAIERAIYKDIPQTAPIQDPVKLERLLYILAGQISGVFSPNTIAGELEMSARTVETYVNYLERAFLVFSVPNFSPKEETVQRRGKKMYFVDGAVRNAALLRGIAPLNDASEMGILTENLAAAHLISLARHAGVRLYHWRRSSYEVDLLYEEPGTPIAFEIGTSEKHTMRGLKQLVDSHPRYRGNCYFVYPGANLKKPTFTDPGSLPLDLFLLLVGQQSFHLLERRLRSEQIVNDPDYVQRSLFEEL